MTVSGGKGNVKRAEREAMQAQIDALVDRLESLPTQGVPGPERRRSRWTREVA